MSAELPTVWIDDVSESLDHGIYLGNRHPEPDKVDALAPTGGELWLSVYCTDPAEDLDQTTLQVWIAGIAAYDGSAPFGGAEFNTTEGFDGAPTVGVGQIDLYFSSLAPFTSEQVVEVRVVCATTTPGGHTLDETYQFTVQDVVAPQATAVLATYADRVRVTFNEPMFALGAGYAGDVLTASNYTIQAMPEHSRQAVIDVNVASVELVEGSGRTQVEVVADLELSFGRNYRLTIGDVVDDSINVLDSSTRVFDFVAWVPPYWPTDRRFELWQFFSDDDRAGDLYGDTERLVDAWQQVIDVMLWDLDRLPHLWDIDRAPISFVLAMLADMGNPFSFNIDDDKRRKLLDVLVPAYRERGIVDGIVNLVRFFLGIEVEIEEYNRSCWEIGIGELGAPDPDPGDDWETTYLGPATARQLRTFLIRVPADIDDDTERIIAEIARKWKPVNTHFVILEPEDALVQWIIGVSELGVDTLLGVL